MSEKETGMSVTDFVQGALQERNARPAIQLPPEILEQLMAGGDLSSLNTEQRNEYYAYRCSTVGLDPAAQPFEYLQLDGKLVLYAKKGCTEQLASKHGLSSRICTAGVDPADDHYYFTNVEVEDPSGRKVQNLAFVWLRRRVKDKGSYVPDADDPTGVKTAPLAGEDYANAKMKCYTKAHRRAVLSYCGLGMMDETEVETLPVSRQRAEPGIESRTNSAKAQESTQGTSPVFKGKGDPQATGPVKAEETEMTDVTADLFMKIRGCATLDELDEVAHTLMEMQGEIPKVQFNQFVSLGAKKRSELEAMELRKQSKEAF